MTMRLKASIRLAYIAPAGMKFYDSVAHSPETSLVVTAAPLTILSQRSTAFLNQNGSFAFNHVYGLRALLEGSANETFWNDIAGHELQYRVQIASPTARYIPFAFTMSLPSRGYVVPGCMTIATPTLQPTIPPDTIVLYPGRMYRPPNNMALIQMKLYDPERDKPAAYAVVDALYNDTLLVRSISDKEGNLMLCFDYPPPNDATLENGNGRGSGNRERAASAYQWTLTLRAFYTRYPASETIPDFADICRTFSQTNARLWANWTGSARTSSGRLTTVNLTYRANQYLQSTTSSTNLPQSHLFITPVP